MPYKTKKEGGKYCVYKKTGKKVGCTKGTKEAKKKYLAALHASESEETFDKVAERILASLNKAS